MNKIFDKKIIAQNFSRSALSYNQEAQLQKNAAQKLIAITSPFLKKNSQILDLGCGSSFLAQELFSKDSLKIFEIDLSLNMLKSWRERPENIFAIQGDMENLPFRENSFDAIISSFALHWLNDFEKFFSQIFSLLKKNGILAICLPTNNSLTELKSAEIFHFNDFPQTSFLKSLLEKNFFAEKKFHQEIIKQEFDNAHQALKFIKKIGGNYRSNSPRAITKKELAQFNSFCLKNFSSDNKKFSISWDISYFILIKK